MSLSELTRFRRAHAVRAEHVRPCLVWPYESETDKLEEPIEVDEWMRDEGWATKGRIHRARDILLIRYLARRNRLGEHTR